MTSPRGARLLHTVVAMGVALTGGTVAVSCGGIADGGPLFTDGGIEGGDAPYDSIHAYPTDHYNTIHADGYPTIGIVDTDADAYPTIHPADAYPTIGIDTGADAYPTIGIDAGGPDAGYPIIPM